jgi:hypothetical protein
VTLDRIIISLFSGTNPHNMQYGDCSYSCPELTHTPIILFKVFLYVIQAYDNTKFLEHF